MLNQYQYIITCLVILSVFLPGCGKDRFRIIEQRIPVTLGQTTIDILVSDSEAPGYTYLCLHDDEDTSAEAVLDVIGRNGGRLVELRHTGDRNIVFVLDNERYTFDPNRIFTDEGAEASLTRLGRADADALRAVRTFADQILEILSIEPGQILVAAHNNTRGAYSIMSYMPGGEEATNARFLHHADQDNPDDFFFVTDQELYARIREANFNVVLQNNEEVHDDGSLSVYAARNGIPYVNVEAQHGHVEQQVKMLEFLNTLLDDSVSTD